MNINLFKGFVFNIYPVKRADTWVRSRLKEIHSILQMQSIINLSLPNYYSKIPFKVSRDPAYSLPVYIPYIHMSYKTRLLSSYAYPAYPHCSRLMSSLNQLQTAKNEYCATFWKRKCNASCKLEYCCARRVASCALRVAAVDKALFAIDDLRRVVWRQ